MLPDESDASTRPTSTIYGMLYYICVVSVIILLPYRLERLSAMLTIIT